MSPNENDPAPHGFLGRLAAGAQEGDRAGQEGSGRADAPACDGADDPAGNLYISPRTYDEWAAATTESANKAMGGLLKRARAAAVKAKSIVLMGVPADVIVRTARTRRAALIVMGTHGRSGFSRFLLGSVASRVVATSPCPVLTVRGK
jgi:nucleotide-binding universal stress UspA family protein